VKFATGVPALALTLTELVLELVLRCRYRHGSVTE